MMAAAGLAAALMAISAWIVVPLQPVPLTLQLLVVALVALFLPPRWAGAGVGVYLLLGAIGVPVFSQGRAGVGVLLGPTGGYLIGFAVGALLGAAVRAALSSRVSGLSADALGVATVLLTVHALGFLQLMVVAGLTPTETFLAGVVPFVALDMLKGVAAVALAGALRRALVLSPSG